MNLVSITSAHNWWPEEITYPSDSSRPHPPQGFINDLFTKHGLGGGQARPANRRPCAVAYSMPCDLASPFPTSSAAWSAEIDLRIRTTENCEKSSRVLNKLRELVAGLLICDAAGKLCDLQCRLPRSSCHSENDHDAGELANPCPVLYRLSFFGLAEFVKFLIASSIVAPLNCKHTNCRWRVVDGGEGQSCGSTSGMQAFSRLSSLCFFKCFLAIVFIVPLVRHFSRSLVKEDMELPPRQHSVQLSHEVCDQNGPIRQCVINSAL